MSKIVLPRLTGGYLDAARLNQWASSLESAIENTFSLDGTAPNALLGPLDLNGQSLLNSGESSSDPNAVLTRSDIEVLVQGYASGFVRQSIEAQTAGVSQTSYTLMTMNFQPGSNNLAVYVNGVRTWAFTEVSATTFVLNAAPSTGATVTAVTNDYLATVSLPAHKHAWSDLLNIPATASRWPAFSEVTDQPSTFTPSAHTHAASDIVSGRLADARRGVYVQAGAPTLGAGDAGALWFW